MIDDWLIDCFLAKYKCNKNWLHLRTCLVYPLFCCKLYSRPRHWCDSPMKLSAIQYASLRINKSRLLCCGSVFKQIVDSLYLSVFRFTAAVGFSRQFVLVLLNVLYWTSLSIRWSKIRVINFCQLVPPRLINLMNFESTECVQNKTALMCAKNHKNWLTHFEDVSGICGPSNVVSPHFWSTVYVCH